MMFASSFKQCFELPSPIVVSLFTPMFTSIIVALIHTVMRFQNNTLELSKFIAIGSFCIAVLLITIAKITDECISTSHMDSRMVSTYLIVMFVLYEAIAVLTICANFMGFWVVKDVHISVAISGSMYLLDLLIHSIQSSWNHLACINHTLKKIEISDFQLKFSHLYANKFYVNFFALLRTSTALILGLSFCLHLASRTDTHLDIELLLICFVIIFNRAKFTEREHFLLSCTNPAENELLWPEPISPIYVVDVYDDKF